MKRHTGVSEAPRSGSTQAETETPLVAEVVEEDGGRSVAAREVGTCPNCGMPYLASDRFCRGCGRNLPGTQATGRAPSDIAEPPRRAFQCKNCGSLVATSLEQRSYVCPFCDSAYVTEIPTQVSGRQRPEFIIGFAISAEEAAKRFRDWIGRNSWFRPGDLRTGAMTQRKCGVYLPFWHFATLARSRWSAQIGEYWYRTETYTTTDSKGRTVVRTRQVRETEWFPLSGEHEKYYWGLLVPGTTSITAEEAKAIQPFLLDEMQRYDPSLLAGWMVEEYSVPPATARKVAWGEVRESQVREVARFLPGDTYAGLSLQTLLEETGVDLVLLPVHIFSYRYRDKLYRFLVNGQTGKVTGEKPISYLRVALFVGIILLIVALIAMGIWLAQH